MRRLFCLLLCWFWPVLAQAVPLSVDLSSHFVAINTGFKGAEIVVFGSAEENADVVVVVRGPPGLATLRVKERILGIWLNTRSMRFRDAPSFYAAAASQPISVLLSPEKRRFYQIGADQIRVTNLDRKIPQDQEVFRQALVDDRVRHSLYQPGIGDVVFMGQGLFRTNFYLPSNVPTGLYRVSVLLIRGGEVTSQADSPLYVGKVGSSAEIYRFAHEQAFFYGLAAVVFAAFAGWLAAHVFRRS